jgi:hypothetical protein
MMVWAAIVGGLLLVVGLHQSWWWREELKLRREERKIQRDDAIRAMEAELGLPLSEPKERDVTFNPPNLQLTIHQSHVLPGDVLTLRCGWTGCDYQVRTVVSEPTWLEGNNIPGGDILMRHQADHAHWTSDIKIAANW